MIGSECSPSFEPSGPSAYRGLGVDESLPEATTTEQFKDAKNLTRHSAIKHYFYSEDTPDVEYYFDFPASWSYTVHNRANT